MFQRFVGVLALQKAGTAAEKLAEVKDGVYAMGGDVMITVDGIAATDEKEEEIEEVHKEYEVEESLMSP